MYENYVIYTGKNSAFYEEKDGASIRDTSR